MIVYFTFDHDGKRVAQSVEKAWPGVPSIGGSQAIGVMTERGWHSGPGGTHSIGILAIYDPKGVYSCGVATINPSDARKSGAEAAISAGSRVKAKGNQVGDRYLKGAWLMTEPGHEERLTQGIIDVCGSGIPLGGGSSGNNSGTEKGVQLCNGTSYTGSVVVALLYSWLDVVATFENGFKATGQKGVVTKAEGRTVLEIDNRPAIDVYNEWTNGLVSAEAKARDGVILGKVTLWPLGRVSTFTETGEAMFVTIVPVSVTKEGGFTTLNELYQGDDVYLMANNKSTVVAKLKANYKKTLKSSEFEDDAFCGALISLCVCHVLTMEADFPEISNELNDALGKPFLLANTFGEQGSFRKGMTGHGNLMVASLLFTQPSEREPIGRTMSSMSLGADASAVAPTGEVAIAFAYAPLMARLASLDDTAAKTAEGLILKAQRKNLALNSGYEVKSGDGELMAAFPTSVDAVAWAKSVIESLSSIQWPTKIATLLNSQNIPPVVGQRIGIHAGRAEYRFNTGTRKIDYFGLVVNTASRLAHFSTGNDNIPTDSSIILVTEQVVQATAIARAANTLVANPVAQGPKNLKGIDKPVVTYKF